MAELKENTKIEKERIMIVGDLHLGDKKAKGQHLDYVAVCIEALEAVLKSLKINKITKLIFVGDIVDSQIRDSGVMNIYFKYFALYNYLTENHVYSLVGNHDVRSKVGFFQLLESSRLIKTTKTLAGGIIHDNYFVEGAEGYCSYLDFGDLRVHMMNYGEQDLFLHLNGKEPEREIINILVSHHDWYVPNRTPNYEESDNKTVLSEATNLIGTTFIINGHIHHSSYGFIEEEISGDKAYLWNIGCYTTPTRDANLWDKVEFPVFVISEEVDGETGEVTETLSRLSNTQAINLDRFIEIPEKLIPNTEDETEEVDIAEVTAILNTMKFMETKGVDEIRDIVRALTKEEAVYSTYMSVLEQVASELVRK